MLRFPREFGIGLDRLGIIPADGVISSSTVTLLIAELSLQAQEAREAGEA